MDNQEMIPKEKIIELLVYLEQTLAKWDNESKVGSTDVLPEHMKDFKRNQAMQASGLYFAITCLRFQLGQFEDVK